MSRQFQSLQSWRGGRDERQWLAALVEAMEQAAQPERRSEPCDRAALAALRAQLALPAQHRFISPLSLRN